MDWTTGAITRLHSNHPDLAYILTEILNRQDRLTELLEMLTHSHANTSDRMDLSRIAQSLWFRAALLIILAPASGLTLKEALNLMLG
jgi:hypothetical protein